ncbi:alcohol dehydrogenase family protein [Frigidibacter sp. MR17.24]|uniref:alcohol dehydrogenase family protein n=1 Tax=Frigidibacter sp. MR17.24 TaxID=3127345 RepID=UPI003012C5B2
MPERPRTMTAIVTTGVGGYDRLECRQLPVPAPGAGEVLLRVLAAGINNTDINTRLGWYSASVRDGTGAAAGDRAIADGGWNAATPFPLIQGADCCGRVVAAGAGVDPARIGQRVIVRPCMRPRGFDDPATIWMGSDFAGAFAGYVAVPAIEAFAVDCGWSDAELASIPCAYGTAENMVRRAAVGPGSRVLVPGASGGVGSAVVQLARRRGAEVIAVTSPDKRAAVEAIGATRVMLRDDDLLACLGPESVDVVIDNVGGTGFATLLKILRRGGRYATSGAIAGPVVELDLRDLYLKDITLIGCTAWDEPVFADLVSYIEAAEIRPLVAATYPLRAIAEAQEAFGRKAHAGKLVLLPAP